MSNQKKKQMWKHRKKGKRKHRKRSDWVASVHPVSETPNKRKFRIDHHERNRSSYRKYQQMVHLAKPGLGSSDGSVIY